MREILSHFQYLSLGQLWQCRGTPHALHERWGVEKSRNKYQTFRLVLR